MNESLISIVVPIYNVEDYLNECIYSLINQTYKNIEIIVEILQMDYPKLIVELMYIIKIMVVYQMREILE